MLYLTSDHFSVFVPLGLVGFYRYLWYILRLLAAVAYRHIPVPDHPTYIASEDVTIIVPTIDADDNFASAAHTWLAGHPKDVLIITETSVLPALQALADKVNEEDLDKYPEVKKTRDEMGLGGRVKVASVPKANKRLQMAAGIEAAETDIIVFADDDAIWPPTMLPLLLAPFEDQKTGGVGTSQVVKPVGSKLTVWEVLAAFRLSIRNIEIAASTHIDGGIPCLSGRTAAYRSVILKDPEFLEGFTNDLWCNNPKWKLNSGDDKFLTRWMVSRGWNTYAQCCEEAQLLSTMKPDWRFLKQVLRWTRNTWRSDLRSIFVERQVWGRHPFTAFTMIDKFLNPFTLLAGPCLVLYLCIKSFREKDSGGYNLPSWNIILSWFCWLTLTRTAKLAPHLWRRPQDIWYVPAWVAFGYFFAVMKLYALFTLHEVGWGTRAGVGDAADIEETTRVDEKADNVALETDKGTSQHCDAWREELPSLAYNSAGLERLNSTQTIREVKDDLLDKV
ncbi:polysaccharide synthase [Meredithblackwellia eburnea MCA 4105]